MTKTRAALLALAFAVPPLLAGALTIAVRLHGAGASLDAAPTDRLALPGPRPPTTARPLAVIVAGNHGTEITDALPIVELLAASGAFEVRFVAPVRRPSPFSTSAAGSAGLDFVPDLGFAEYDALVGRAPALLVVPYAPRWQAEDAALIPWIRAHAGADTMVLSVCQGAELVAATGLFDGHAATANAGMLDALARRYPRVRWQRDVRWVRDDRRMSSALLAAGLDATLAAIEALAGRGAAERAARETGYRLRASGDRSQPASRIPIGVVLEIAYRWERARVDVVIADGDAESAIAGLIDASAAMYTGEPVAVAASRRIVRTRHGLALVPRATIADVSSGDDLAVAGAAGPGAYGYDAAIAWVAAGRGGPAARITALLLDYPSARLALPAGLPVGVAVALRPLLLGLIGLGVMRRWALRRVDRARNRARHSRGEPS